MFRAVESNLRQSFRALALARPAGDVAELPGLTIASAGVKFQMFNAAFFSSPLVSPEDVTERVVRAAERFQARQQAWALWVCESWLARNEMRTLSRECQRAGLRPASEMPGMVLDALRPSKRLLPMLELREITGAEALRDFRAIGSVCFHVPHSWFGEVFDEEMHLRPDFRGYTGYLNGEPVATSAWVRGDEAIGLYNIATVPEYREKGIAEAITRATIGLARRETGIDATVLQSTSMGFRLYQRLGFREVTRILVYNSL